MWAEEKTLLLASGVHRILGWNFSMEDRQRLGPFPLLVFLPCPGAELFWPAGSRDRVAWQQPQAPPSMRSGGGAGDWSDTEWSYLAGHRWMHG